MHISTILWIVVGVAVVGVVAVLGFVYHAGSDDLGSVSAAWTTEHTLGDRGGDHSNG